MKQKCLLCDKECDFLVTGSHIIPDFLIRSLFTWGKDKNKRADDNQVIFTSSSTFNVKEPFVRIPDTQLLEESFSIFKKDLNAGEKYNNQNDYTVDDIFCSKCETNLLGTQLETYFSTEVYRQCVRQ